MLGADDASRPQYFRSNGGLAEFRQSAEIYDIECLAENIGKAALGHAAMQRHLAAFKSAHHTRTAARTLAFVATRRGFAHPGAHTATHTLLVLRRFFRCSNIG